MNVRIAGIDEAGRGALAGPVYAAAVILPPRHSLDGLDDSKVLPAARREMLAVAIRAQALAWAVASASAEEIDAINILQATLRAMQRAVTALAVMPDEVWVDGTQAPPLALPVRTIVDGDALHDCIMAASILAKVARDAEMRWLDGEHPGYGFAQHKGYGTPAHQAALRRLGPSQVHRKSFAPVRQLPLVPETGA